MSNETSREGFEEWFNSTELPDCLTTRDGKSSVTVNVESICRTAWQARDAEVNELRKENKRLTQIVEVIEEFKKMSNSAAKRDLKQIAELRKEVERLNNTLIVIKRMANTCREENEEMELTLHQIAINSSDAIKAAKEGKQ